MGRADFDPTAVDWGRVFTEALELALRFSTTDAEDLVQRGITLLLEGAAPYDAEGGQTIAEHVVAVAKKERDNRRRKERLRRARGTEAKLEHWLDEAPPTPEELSEERLAAEAAYARLLGACEKDPDVRALAELSRRDIDEPAEQQKELGWHIDRVRNARKRMGRMVAAVAASMNGEDGEEVEP
jgi:hypothetical protein